MNFIKRILQAWKERSKEKEIEGVVKDIKDIKIQGAKNVAREALKAYRIKPTEEVKRKLLEARPTEPMLGNSLKHFEEHGYKETVKHFEEAQQKINEEVLELIEGNPVIFTHCHSSTVVEALINAKKEGKEFSVYNTETRPLYQGRKTSKELARQGIEVTTFTDDAARIAIKALQGTKKADLVFLGSDALLEEGIINKIGSGMFSTIANENDIPLYVLADSWKYTKHVDLEKRDFEEVWKNKPSGVKIENPAFEKIPSKHIKRVISDLGTYTLKTFVKKAKKELN